MRAADLAVQANFHFSAFGERPGSAFQKSHLKCAAVNAVNAVLASAAMNLQKLLRAVPCHFV